MDERLLEGIDKNIDISNEYLYDIRALLTEIRDLLKPTQTINMPPINVSPPPGVSTEGASWAMEGAK